MQIRIILRAALLLLSPGVASLAQQNVNTAVDVFPLAVGNSWYYLIYHFNENPFRISRYTIRVVRDSVMPNGKLYYVLDSADMFGKQFLRADSTYLYYWDNSGPNSIWAEHRTFNLRAPTGEVDTINLGNYPTCEVGRLSRDTIFGNPTATRDISLGGGILFDGLTLADGFGYLAFEYSGDRGDVQYAWHLQGCVISDRVCGMMTAVRPSAPTPARAELHQNYPNPFNPATLISYDLPSRTHVSLVVCSLLGQHVATLVDGVEEPGSHTVVFSGVSLSTGVYVYRLQAGGYVLGRKLVMVK